MPVTGPVVIPDKVDEQYELQGRILNTVWQGMGLDYQQRVPIADQGNILDVAQTLRSFDFDWNKFLSILMNNIVLDIFRRHDWNNPLAQFKVSRVVEHGSVIREMAFNLIPGVAYDPNSTELLRNFPPEMVLLNYRQNRQSKYRVTINEDMMQQALFANPQSGLANLINSILSLPFTSDQNDEYRIMEHLFGVYQNNSQFYNVQIPNILTSTDKEADGKTIQTRIRQMLLDFQFLSTRFNPAHIPTATDNPVLFATPAFVANLDVNVLAAAFNMGKADFSGRLVVVQHFDFDTGNDASFCVLADPGLYVAADTKVKSATFFNPDTLMSTSWLHRWGIYGMSPAVNAVLFSTRASTASSIDLGTVTSVALSFAPLPNGIVPEAVMPGGTIIIGSSVTGTGNFSHGVRFRISGTSGVPMDSNTFIDAGTGILHVSSEETNTEIVIQGMSTQNNSIVGTLTVPITPDGEPPEETED